jgi:putative exporter of polyketide antibiotics
VETIKASEEQVAEELETVQQTANAAFSQIVTARQMITKANAILCLTELTHEESMQRLKALTAQSVSLVKEEATKVGDLEAARARLANTLALAEDGLMRHALATVEEERDRELSILELKLRSYVPR